ncbi:MAG: ATP-binding cassette domain-containing protein [Aliishimia sp.]
MVSPPHLRVSGIHKRFGAVHALRGVDFEVTRGEVMALVDDNGAGKSTLMKVLAGVHAADEGQLFIDETLVSVNSAHDASNLSIQIVYQDARIWMCLRTCLWALSQ